MMRVRVRFAKHGKIRWTSHRDLARMWERALRRARLPVAYTEGFSPRPKVSFGLALPTGHESLAEYLDVELTERVETDALPPLLSSSLPTGVDALAAREAATSEGSLQHEVASCSWLLEVRGPGEHRLRELVDAAMSASSITVTRSRKGRQLRDDIRPAVLGLEVSGPGEAGVMLEAVLATQPRGVRPSELLGALGGVAAGSGAADQPTLELGRALRTHQWIDSDGARREPIPLGATDAAHALERAS